METRLMRASITWPRHLENLEQLRWIQKNTHNDSGTPIAGSSGIDKSPFVKELISCRSREDHLGSKGVLVGKYRFSSEMDFFRGRPGVVEIGDIFDDGDSSAQRPKTLKAFGDVPSEEAVAIAMLTGCRWMKGQPRALLDNKYDQDAELKAQNKSGGMEMVRPF